MVVAEVPVHRTIELPSKAEILPAEIIELRLRREHGELLALAERAASLVAEADELERQLDDAGIDPTTTTWMARRLGPYLVDLLHECRAEYSPVVNGQLSRRMAALGPAQPVVSYQAALGSSATHWFDSVGAGRISWRAVEEAPLPAVAALVVVEPLPEPASAVLSAPVVDDPVDHVEPAIRDDEGADAFFWVDDEPVRWWRRVLTPSALMQVAAGLFAAAAIVVHVI